MLRLMLRMARQPLHRSSNESGAGNYMKFKFRRAAALAALALTSACAQKAPLRDAATLATEPVYRLGAGDTIRVTVFKEPSVGGDFTVSDSGNINLPLLGPLKADGLTLEDLRLAITAGLSGGFVNNPHVTAQVISFRPYFVMGEVAQPGRYPLEEKMTVVRAIATAGGFTPRANKKFVFLRRSGQPEVRVLLNSDFQILPGDVIRIGERYF